MTKSVLSTPNSLSSFIDGHLPSVQMRGYVTSSGSFKVLLTWNNSISIRIANCVDSVQLATHLREFPVLDFWKLRECINRSLLDQPLSNWQTFQRTMHEENVGKCTEVINSYLRDPSTLKDVQQLGLAPNQVEKDSDESVYVYFEEVLYNSWALPQKESKDLLEAFREYYPLIYNKLWRRSLEKKIEGLDLVKADAFIRGLAQKAKGNDFRTYYDLKIFANDPIRRFSFLTVKIERLKAQLTVSSPEKSDLNTIGSFLEKIGKIIPHFYLELKQLSLDVICLNVDRDELKNGLRDCQEQFNQLVFQQKGLQKQYEQLYKERLRGKIEKHLLTYKINPSGKNCEGNKSIGEGYSNVEEERDEYPVIYVEKWQIDEKLTRKLNDFQHKTLCIKIYIDSIRAANLNPKIKYEKELLDEQLKQCNLELRKLEIQRLTELLNQIIETTNQYRCRQKKIGSTIPELTAWNQLRQNKFELLIDDLKDLFQTTLERYEKYKIPPRTLFDLLQDASSALVREMALWTNNEDGYIASSEFRTKWEIANLGYQFNEAIAQFGNRKYENFPQAVDQLCRGFLVFANNHPSIAESISADVAITLSAISGDEVLHMFQKGISARLLTHTLLEKIGHFVEHPLAQEDLKWIALKDVAKNGPWVAALINAVGSAFTELRKRGLQAGVTEGLVTGLTGITKISIIQKAIKKITSEHLGSIHDIVGILRGEKIEDILASKQRLFLVQMAGQAVQVLNDPKEYLQRLLESIHWQKTLFKHASSTEKKVRVLGILIIPIVGALLAIQAGLSVFLVIPSLLMTFPSACALMNSYYSSSVQAAKEKETLKWVEQNYKDEIQKSADQVVDELHKIEGLSNVKIDIVLEEGVKAYLKQVISELEQAYQYERKIVGELQLNEVLHLYSSQDLMKQIKLLPGLDEKAQKKVKKWLQKEIIERWLKDKILEACQYEFSVMLTHYNSPEEYEKKRGKREGVASIPVSRSQAQTQIKNAKQSVEQAVKKNPLLQNDDGLISKITTALFSQEHINVRTTMF